MKSFKDEYVMKTNYNKILFKIFIISFLMYTNLIYGQAINKFGIYLTSEDFSEKKLNYGFDFSESRSLTLKDSKVILHDRSNSKEFKLGEIWGIRYDGKDFRLSNEHYFKILYYGHIIIYSTVKKSSKYDQSFEYEEKFFSKDLNSSIFKLKKGNIKAVYSDNKAILKKLKNLPANYSISKWYEECDCFIITKWFD